MEILRRSAARRRPPIRKAQTEGRRRGLYQPMGSHRFGGPVASKSAASGGEEVAPYARPRLGTRLTDGPGRLYHHRSNQETSTSLPGTAQGRVSPRESIAMAAVAATSATCSSPGSPSTYRSPRLTPVLASNSASQPSPGRLASPVLGGVRGQPVLQTFDADRLFKELMGRDLLSCTPRAPPWPQEPSGRSDIDAVRIWLQNSLPTIKVQTVLRVECTLASAAYEGVRKTLGPERLLWHGTSWDSVANIVRHGFNRAYGGRHGQKLGKGSYFAEDAAYAMRFCGRNLATRAIFLAGVLPGRCCRGEENLVEPPADASGARFDSTVDDAERPRVFCVFRDFQALPLYVAEVASDTTHSSR